MEDRIINILIDIKADISGLKKGQEELKEGQQRLEGRMGKLEGRMDTLEEDVSDVKNTVNALADALLETSKEVRQIKGKAAHH